MKKKNETKAIKVKRYKNRMKTADKAPYLMRVVSNGEVHLDDILREVAKGKATLEVVLAGEEPDTYRFTASRKVTVR